MSTPTGIAFPGQGNAPALMRESLELHRDHPLVDATLRRLGAVTVSDLDLRDTAVTQPATFAASLAAADLVDPVDIELAVGHSLGELSAATFLGFLSPEVGLDLAFARGAVCSQQQHRRPGGMAAVTGTDLFGVEWLRRRVIAHTQGVLEIAGLNGRRQTVVSGDLPSLHHLQTEAGLMGVLVNVLPIGGSFHSPLMADALDEWQSVLAGATFTEAARPLVSTVDAAVHVSRAEVQDVLGKALLMPVRWTDAIQIIVSMGVTQLWDTGPGTTLAKLGRRDKVISFVDVPPLGQGANL
jgi:[acyl-carrier-protein] S-malonyltransferase